MQLGTETLRVEASRSEEDSGGWGFIKTSAGSVGGRRDYYGRDRTRALCRCLRGAVVTSAQTPCTRDGVSLRKTKARQHWLCGERRKCTAEALEIQVLWASRDDVPFKVLWMNENLWVKTSAQNLACWQRQIHTVPTCWLSQAQSTEKDIRA